METKDIFDVLQKSDFESLPVDMYKNVYGNAVFNYLSENALIELITIEYNKDGVVAEEKVVVLSDHGYDFIDTHCDEYDLL